MRNLKRWKRLMAVAMCSAMMLSVPMGVSATDSGDTKAPVTDNAEIVDTDTDTSDDTDTDTSDGTDTPDGSGDVTPPTDNDGTDTDAGDGTENDGTEEDVMPTVEPTTLEYVPGKEVEIPVKMGTGKYDADSVFAIGTLALGQYDAEKGVIRLKMYDNFWTGGKEIKSGDYDVEISFYNSKAQFEYKNTDVKIHMGMDSKCLHLIGTSYIADGSKDLVYKFENGSGAFELKEIEAIGFRVDARPMDGGAVPYFTESSQFTYDLGKGTVTIKGSALKNYTEDGKKITEDWLYMSVVGKTVQGNTICTLADVGGGSLDVEDGFWYLKYEDNGQPATTNPTHVEPYGNNGVISKARMQELVELNKEQDIVINTPEGVTFTFEKGTMHMVEGMENYPFGVDLVTDYSKSGINDSKITEDTFAFRINYEYSGELPGTARISIPVNSKWNGSTLYYYQIMPDGTLKDTGRNSRVTNGIFNVYQTHCSDYVLLANSPKELGLTSTKVPTSPKTGDTSTAMLFMILCMGACLAGAGAVKVKCNNR